MNESIKFSVIIPVYNNEKYVRKCINSVLKQTYKNFEIIAVDDGSTDKSGKILDKLAQKNPNLKIIHQKNKGVVEARKTAINQSCGKYICFLDSDDWYEPNFLQCVNRELTDKDIDMVQVGHTRSRPPIKKKVHGTNATLQFDKSLLIRFLNGYGEISYTLWDKVYPSATIKRAMEETDTVLKICEDAYLNYIVLLTGEIHKVSIIEECLYNYRLDSGITSSKDRIMVYKELMSFKQAMYNYSLKKINEESVFRSIFVDTAVMSKYYSCVITEKIKNKEEKEKLIYDVILNNPTVSEAKDFFIQNGTTIPECVALVNYDATQYTDYIINYYKEYKKNMTIHQKINRIFSFIK